MTQAVMGAKGAGNLAKQAVPVEQDDTLKSRSYAKLLDVLCEGEIEGLALPGMQAVFLDDTPIENSDGSYNFSGIEFEFRPGSQDQGYIPAFPAVERDRVLSLEVKHDQPITQTVDDLNLNVVRVKAGVSALVKQQSNGDRVGHSVQFAFDLRESGGAWVEVINGQFTGKSSGAYEREFVIELTGQGPWQIRMRRISEDETKASHSSTTYWSGMTEVILSKLRFPNTALAGIVVDAAQFRSVPKRTYLIKGTRIQVPSNYDPETATYTGVWDGTFKVAWSANPAWCLYDLCTTERYGLGRYLTGTDFDKWELYQIAKYCDELVPDGRGGQERRFEMHCYIDTARQALQVVMDLISCFRSMILWDGQKVWLSQDAPRLSVAQRFTNDNVKEGQFKYAGSGRTARHTVALVEWADPDNNYESSIQYIEDPEGIQRYGYNEARPRAFGCTSPGQAARVGRWLLYSERMETDTVTFVAGLDALSCRPGEIIEIADQQRAGQRTGGRIKSSLANAVTLMESVLLEAGQVYTLHIAAKAGGYHTRTVTNAPGEVSALAFDDPLPEMPVDHALWVLSSVSLALSTWRVISVVEREGEYDVTAIEHNPSKYDHIEQGLTLDIPTTTPSYVPKAPTGLAVTERLYSAGGRILNSATLVCQAQPGVAEYEFGYNRDGLGWIDTRAAGPEHTVHDVQTGDYRFRARAVGQFGQPSSWVYLDQAVLGKVAPPADVQNLAGRADGGIFRLTWDPTVDLDVQVGGRVLIRFSHLSDQWDQAADLGLNVSGADTGATLPLMAGKYLVKFQDASGSESVNPMVVHSDVSVVLGRNIVEQIDHSAEFPGVMSGFVFDPGLQALSIDGLGLFDDLTGLIDDYPDFDSAGGYLGAATYEFVGPDLGAVFSARITADIEMDISRAPGGAPGVSAAETSSLIVQISHTSDDPASEAAEWTPWARFVVGDYSARATRYRLVYASSDSYNRILLKRVRVTVDLESRLDSQADILAPVEGVQVSYEHPFYRSDMPPGITAVNMHSGDYYEITNLQKTGFHVRFFNAQGQPVERRFNYYQKSY